MKEMLILKQKTYLIKLILKHDENIHNYFMF